MQQAIISDCTVQIGDWELRAQFMAGSDTVIVGTHACMPSLCWKRWSLQLVLWVLCGHCDSRAARGP